MTALSRTDPHPLSAIDQVFIGHAVCIVLEYSGGLDAARLATALDTALAAFPPLTGGIVDRAGTGYGLAPLPLQPRWLDVRDVPALPDGPFEPSSFDAWVPRLVFGPEQPLFSARLTRAPSASILAMTMSHAVADGYGLFSFMSAWARAARGRSITPPPWDRRLLDNVTNAENVVALPAREPITPADVWQRTGFSWVPGQRRALAEPLPATFGTRLLPPALRPLVSGRPLSDNDLICSWLIQEHAAALAGPDGFAVTIPVDYRRALGGPLIHYFGNAVRCAPLWLDHAAIEQRSLPHLAERVNEAVRSVIDERGARDSIACLEQLLREQGPSVFGELHVADPRAGLLVTNVSRLPLAMLDFGSGPPVRASLPAVEERTAAIQQAEEDAFEVSLCLPRAPHAPRASEEALSAPA